MDKPLPVPPFQFPVSKIPRRPLGYDRDETESVFASLAASYEQIWVEREGLRDRVAALEADLERMREQEPLLRDALVEAHRAARATREQAEHEAEAILERARAEADELLEARHDELRAREDELAAGLAEERSRAEAELERIRGLAQAAESDLTSFLRDLIEQARNGASDRRDVGDEARSA